MFKFFGFIVFLFGEHKSLNVLFQILLDNLHSIFFRFSEDPLTVYFQLKMCTSYAPKELSHREIANLLKDLNANDVG